MIKIILKRFLGDGSQFGINLKYAIQNYPNGIAEAFIIGEEFIGDSSITLILGDNIFHGNTLNKLLKTCFTTKSGATIFAYPVKDPERYGVIQFDQFNKVISIEEKPQNPKSIYAITGIYVFDNTCYKESQKV